MSDPLSIGLSGLIASSSRLQTAANNIANVRTTSRVPASGNTPTADESLARQQAFAPQRTQQTPLPGGGVKARQVPVDPSHVTAYAPDDPNANTEGLVNFPNVSLAEELVQLRIAAQTYKANALVIRTAEEISDVLINDIKR